MAEVRTTSRSGGQKGVKPERHSLIPRRGLDAIARVFGFGATKYADHNWRKGYEWSKSYDALVRHVTAFWDGETNDPESGLPHLAHAGFHILVLLTWLEEQGEGGEFDDRYRPDPGVFEGMIRGGSISPCLIHEGGFASFAEEVTARFVAGPWGTEDTDDSTTVADQPKRETVMEIVAAPGVPGAVQVEDVRRMLQRSFDRAGDRARAGW